MANSIQARSANGGASGRKPARKARPARGKSSEAEMKRLRQAEMLLDLSKRVAAIETLDEVLEILVEMTSWEVGAERATLFLNDPQTGELYSRVAQGNFTREIRILNDSGVAGFVFTEAEGVIIHDAYADPRFNRSVDEQTGFKTRNILCAPVRTVKGDVIGVIQALNKKKGDFTEEDLSVLEAMTTQAAVALQSTQFVERMKKSREQEMEFLDIVADVTSELELGTLLQRVMGEATRMLQADRSTLFLNDPKTNELFARVAQGVPEIRLPNHLGIAGAVFTSGKTVNIPYAYADLRFNPAFDKKTGYFTRSILCVPVVNKENKVIGVTQVLNKRGGPFTDEDETRLKAFTAQVSIALENAKLFEDVQKERNYIDSMLQSMSNGVVTLDEDDNVNTCNAAGRRILKIKNREILEREVIGKPATEFFSGANEWVMEAIERVKDSHDPEEVLDKELVLGEEDEKISVNLTVLPLLAIIDEQQKMVGVLVMMEDISGEKRMKSTMAKYGLSAQRLSADQLEGESKSGTVLFTDVRSFTTLTEDLGPKGTVTLLNEYFEIMVDCIDRQGGVLDKFIGDAIMATFGIYPDPKGEIDDWEDRGVKAAIAMLTELEEWNQQRAAVGQKPVKMGCGLNSDEVVSGNIGSPKRMDLTIIGDGVNLAARLESACKQYHAQILLSEHTVGKLRSTYRLRDIDDVVVKGKTKPVTVFECLDHHTDATFANVADVVNAFREGRKYYKAGDWDRATQYFQEALKANPNDELSQDYVGRCEMLKANPPTDWKGVWVMTSK